MITIAVHYFQVTYKALEQFSESEFDLDRLEAEVKKTRQSQNLEVLVSKTVGTKKLATIHHRPPKQKKRLRGGE